MAITADGFVCVIDLLKDPYNPIASEFCISEEQSSSNTCIIADLSSPSVGGKTSYLAMSRESSRGSRPKEISQWVRKIITKHSIVEEECGATIEELCVSMETWMARVQGNASITTKSSRRDSDDSNSNDNLIQ